ncbi:nicotinate phosphoribosyltransferase [Mycobacteroides abscessus]|uniref:nicotinate phosphoribosyltransferase n=1 Tax=Mycobacteroides abscessus TaxID=36809 RepID=UPI000C2680D3|nr:nicotinate phosphoribosyltransferase [Mycobacteroides abscessus]
MTATARYAPSTLAAVDILMATDAYKLDHRRQYPVDTEYVYSNLTARGSRIPGVNWCVFFGLQAHLRDITSRWQSFFDADIDEVCAAYARRLTQVLGPNNIDTDHIRELHAYGRIPLEFRALPEGTIVPNGVPFFTMKNTAPQFFWFTNYIETELSAALWQPITSATIAWYNRVLLDERAVVSGAAPEAVDWQGHDFSYRGMAGTAAAAASGAAHLLSFTGTDSLPALGWIDHNYPGTPDNALIGGSVPATEHSVMCANGQGGELQTFEHLLNLYPSGIVSVVSDTWNLWQVLTEFLPALKGNILARDGKLVIRPDSGDPEKILCGDPDAAPSSPQWKGVVRLLAETFGTTTNDKGYKELNSHVGVIYGDSITHQRADSITSNLIAQGYSSTTPILGFGSYTYQYVTRDTFSIAMKATWVQVNGQGRDIAKDPITDPGKRSARGRLAVTSDPSEHLALRQGMSVQGIAGDQLRPVFFEGELLEEMSFGHVRDTLRADWTKYAARKGQI